MIGELIERADRLCANGVLRIENKDRLITALKSLDDLIEMKEAKESICLQIQYLIMKLISNESKENLFEDHMLHTVISGPPGVGKTQLAKALADIWQALGILDEDEPLDEDIKMCHVRVASEILSLNRTIVTYRRYPDMYNYLKGIRSRLQSIIDADRPKPRSRSVFTIANRADFVAKYLGQTAHRTKALLEKCRGGVLFIDEAYSLINGSTDQYGMEALTVLNQFMSENPTQLIVIFAGYKDMLDDTIFKAQPGLKRRCGWTFNVDSYSGEGLASIFRKQLSSFGWSLSKSVDLPRFFSENHDGFPNYGGDTHRLAYQCKLCHMQKRFLNLDVKSRRRHRRVDKIIDADTLKDAYRKYRANNTNVADRTTPNHMYL